MERYCPAFPFPGRNAFSAGNSQRSCKVIAAFLALCGSAVAQNSVNVTVIGATGLSENLIGDIVLDQAGAHARFAVIPGFIYAIERSTDAANWTPMDTVTAPESGIIEFLDAAPPAGPVYYRTTSP